jgi:FMN phosphatase YigB (HAD superfamily)
MIEDGAEIFDYDKALKELLALNEVSSRSRDAILQFASKVGCNPARALKELTAPLPKDFTVPMTPFAKDILNHFRLKYKLSIVTGGHPPFQMEKIEKAGLEPSIFCKIAIPEDSIKKPFYRALAEEFLAKPEEIWVCGDRIEMDLLPARELGFRTVHMRWGRGLMTKTADWVEYSIETLMELKGIIR